MKKTPKTHEEIQESKETVEAEPVESEIVQEPLEEEAVEEKADPIDELNQEIDNLNKQLEESKNSLLRAYADTDNTRKRLLREAESAKKYRFQSAALELLPILDNMENALKAKPESEEAATFVKGFEMILQQLETALKNEGVEEIEAVGKPFDANFMQALMTEPKEDTEPGTVLEVLQKGYKLKDRLLRPALVKVSE